MYRIPCNIAVFDDIFNLIILKYTFSRGWAKKSNMKNLKVIVGSLTDKVTLTESIVGSDVVISALGPAMSMKRQVKDLPIANAHKAIISVMEENNCRRFITLATPTISANEDVNQLVTVLPSKMAKILYPTGYAEMKGIESMVKNSKLDWTVIRIVNSNVKNDANGYAVTLGDTKGKMNVSRLNVAKGLLDAATKEEWIQKMPIIFNK